MLLGEVAPKTFTYSTVAVVLFVLFMFLVVILLANVLIAIVTDSYKVIQDQRAAIVSLLLVPGFISADHHDLTSIVMDRCSGRIDSIS